MTGRAPIPHIVLLDGTLATLGGPRSSHVWTIRRLVRKAGPVRVHYARGIHWDSWGGVRSVITGQGIEDRISWSHHVVGYERTSADGVRAVFADGSRSPLGSLLVGGEGIYSKVARMSDRVAKMFNRVARMYSKVLECLARY